ncbi:MAG: hypothetical protein FWE09_09365, partial [Treponema sp.]|nr:hypothetical protein [Treponema sp.]
MKPKKSRRKAGRDEDVILFEALFIYERNIGGGGGGAGGGLVCEGGGGSAGKNHYFTQHAT